MVGCILVLFAMQTSLMWDSYICLWMFILDKILSKLWLKLSTYGVVVASIFYTGVRNSADLCSTQTQTHHLGKQLGTIYNAHHPVYDFSHYIVKNHQLDVHCNLLNAKWIARASCFSCSFNSCNCSHMLKLHAQLRLAFC